MENGTGNFPGWKVAVPPKGYQPVNSETPSWGGGGTSRALKCVTFSEINRHDILLF